MTNRQQYIEARALVATRLPGLCVPPIPDCSDLLAIPSIKRRGMTPEMIAAQMLEDVRYWRAMHPGRDWLAIVPPSWRDYIRLQYMRPTALEIMKAVAVRYGVTLEDLRSHSRVARLATARAVVCYLLYRYYNYSLKDVGRMVLRDHSSVMHSVRLVEGFCLWPKMYATDLAIIEEIKQKYLSDGQ